MKINVVNRTEARIPRKFLNQWLKLISKELAQRGHSGLHLLQLHIVFVTAKEGKKLNFKFRNKNYATDVLSFEPLESSDLGELVLCEEVLKRQALENEHSFKKELGYMILHGVLHLLGYDHEKSIAKAKQMFVLQDAVYFKLLNIVFK
jgi:probable rRNA maturation factor